MSRLITQEQIESCVRNTLPQISFVMPPDIRYAFEAALDKETNARGKRALEMLLTNADIAAADQVPLCQDTGYVWCCLEVGPDITIEGNVMDKVDETVARIYKDHYLRKSLVHDALFNRTNTQDNTPAFAEVKLSKKPGARLHVMCKGGGSDNASRVVMLAPGAGRQGVIDVVMQCVREKAANACPPLIIGVGVGSTFDKVAGLAKMALMRPLDQPTQDEDAAQLEEELLVLINQTDIGPAALGGQTTALGVRVNTAPCHIAALPVAVNMGCSALRRATYEL